MLLCQNIKVLNISPVGSGEWHISGLAIQQSDESERLRRLDQKVIDIFIIVSQEWTVYNSEGYLRLQPLSSLLFNFIQIGGHCYLK